MDIAKLFGVLVVGGSLLVASGCEGPNDPDNRNDNVVTEADAADPTGDAANTSPDATGEELAPCFCDSQACCDDGTLQDGFECCWGTTC